MKLRWIIGLLAGLAVTVGVARIQETRALAQSQVQAQAQSQAQGFGHSNPFFDAFITEAQRIERGYAIAPVRLNLRNKDLVLVGLGSYLVNATGGCNDCHTNPAYAEGGDPFKGEPKKVNAANYLAGGATFGPFFVSRNITPDENGRPAGLTFAQFRQVMRTGIDLKNAHPQQGPLLQVMPWPVYQDLVDRDLRAIYEYLRSIPHAEPAQ